MSTPLLDRVKKEEACSGWTTQTSVELKSYRLSSFHLVLCTILLDKSKANKLFLLFLHKMNESLNLTTVLYLRYCKKQLLKHFIPLVSLYTPWKYKKTKSILMFSGGLERGQWRETVKRTNALNWKISSAVVFWH